MVQGPEKRSLNERAKDDYRDRLGIHSETLFDVNENVLSGETVNPATGKPYDNTMEEVLGAQLQVVEPSSGSEDVLPLATEEDDEAAKWLRAHDPKKK